MVRKAAESKQEVTPVSEAELPDFGSFDEALNHFVNGVGVVAIGDVAGDGYTLTKDKESLVNVPFLIVDWNTVTDPSTQRDYATIRLITQDNRKIRINDGSTGIFKQLQEIRERHNLTRGIGVPKGLFTSEYWICDDRSSDKFGMVVNPDYEGPKRQATTYYLNTAS